MEIYIHTNYTHSFSRHKWAGSGPQAINCPPMLKDKVVPWVKKVTGNKGIKLQQDGATSHRARLVQDWCEDNFKLFGPKELWPPFSLI